MRIVVCLLLLIVVPPIPGQAPNQSASKPTNPKDNASTKQQATTQIRSAFIRNPSTAESPQERTTQHPKSDDPVPISTVEPLDIRADISKDWMDKLNWVFTGILLLIGGLGVYAALRTLRVIRRQADLMHEQGVLMARQAKVLEDSVTIAGIQVKVAQCSVDVAVQGVQSNLLSLETAKESLRLASDTAQRQLRAYFCVDTARLEFQDDDTISATVRLSNFGQTPAYTVRHWMAIQIAEYPLAHSLREPLDHSDLYTAVVPPSGGSTAVLAQTGTSPSRTLGSRSRTVYVYGKASYIDVFSQPRTTIYRLVFGGHDRPVIVDSIGMLTPDTAGNEAT
jgi:hypothetical protein